jgi:hypothetical protein
MVSTRIENAVARLERNLPIRRNQARLCGSLRRLHQWILRHYLEHGVAPSAGDFGDAENWWSGVERLAAEHIILLDDTGAITGAYPFVGEAREFRVTTGHGPVDAMCAFDALAVSSMFGVPARIESRCRLSGQAIEIEQDGSDIRVIEPRAPVFAAIDWQAAAGASSCSATLCMEMMFIVGEARAVGWCAGGGEREYFDLAEAHAVIAAIFLPLME